MSTASNTTTGATSSDTPEHGPQSPFSCNGCAVRFETLQEQHTHMKEPWHIYNIKRRMATLPSISEEIFKTQIEHLQAEETVQVDTISDMSSSCDSDESLSEVGDYAEEEAEQFPPSRCIFCDVESSSIQENVLHMSSHGLYIPDIPYLLDLETFISYLGLLVVTYHECLSCGHTKGSVQGVRQHMLAKGHCMIHVNDSSDLIDFWSHAHTSDDTDKAAVGGTGGQAVPPPLSKTEMRLPSGVIVTSRSEKTASSAKIGARHRSFVRRAKMKTILDGAETEAPQSQERSVRSRDQRVAVRGEMGMIGVPEQQKKALRAMEKKLLKQEVVARAHQRWAVEKVANRQKNFKPDVPGRLNG